jgi:GAF domain-containing protein
VLRQVATQNDDEIGLLAHTLADMAAQLEHTLGQLEARVAERTQTLEHRTLQLQTAAEVAREITQAQDLESLLRGAVDLISERFGYYNVGIFLVDELSEYAHLKAASGELGRQLLQKEIRMRVGQEGLVGYVTRFGQPRIAADVSQERAYVAERLLPDTRSELTLPLRSGPKIIGALDVQSAQPNAFSQDDITVLQTLADQLATAIENVRLTARLLTTLEEANLATQQQARQAWQRLATQRGELVFEYDRLEARQISPSELRNASGALLRVPVSLRGQVIGYIGLEADDPEREWSADELAIVEATANQAALTVENARLLLESQQRAARERIAAEVTAQLRASLDMQTVLQSAVQEIAQRMGIAQVEVELTAMEGDGNPPEDGDGRPAQPDRREQDGLA